MPNVVSKNSTKIQILPCDGNIFSIKIFKLKIIQANEVVYKPAVIQIDDTKPGDLLIIKIVTSKEHQRSQKIAVRYQNRICAKKKGQLKLFFFFWFIDVNNNGHPVSINTTATE